MAKVHDISPKFAVKTAADELKYEVTPGELPMADNWGGTQVFSRSWKRGAGDNTFGLDENGLWMGAAEFADAPFRVDFSGNVTASSATFGQYLDKTSTGQTLTGNIGVGGSNVLIDGANGRIVMISGGVNRGVWGDV